MIVDQNWLTRLQTATRLRPDEYTGWVYDDFSGVYAESVTDLADKLLEGKLPAFAWACEGTSFIKIDVDELLSDIEESAYEGFDGDFHGEDELRAAVEAFEKANEAHVTYYPDYTRVIVFDEAETAKMIDTNEKHHAACVLARLSAEDKEILRKHFGGSPA